MKRTICILFLVGILLSACDALPASSSVVQSVPSGSAGIMLTNPYDGEHLSLGQPCDIRSEISSTGSVASVILLINSEPYREDTFLESYQAANVYQPWTPREPGEYLLQTVFTDGDGSQHESNAITVFVDPSLDEVAPEEEPEAAEEPVEEEIECAVPVATTTGYANCRSGPGTGYGIVEGLKPGQEFTMLARSSSGTWYRIGRTLGGECWIWANLIEICGDAGSLPADYMQEKDDVPQEEPEEPGEDETPEPPQDPTKDPGEGPTTL